MKADDGRSSTYAAEGTHSTARPDATVSTVGQAGGRLVLRLERLVRRPPGAISRALSAPHPPCGCPCAAAGAARWEVHRAADGARVALTTWIDGHDAEAAARAGARSHVCFEQIAHALESGSAAPSPCACATALVARYTAAVATTLADAD